MRSLASRSGAGDLHVHMRTSHCIDTCCWGPPQQRDFSVGFSQRHIRKIVGHDSITRPMPVQCVEVQVASAVAQCMGRLRCSPHRLSSSTSSGLDRVCRRLPVKTHRSYDPFRCQCATLHSDVPKQSLLGGHHVQRPRRHSPNSCYCTADAGKAPHGRMACSL